MKTTASVSGKAVARIKAARAKGAKITYLTFGASDRRGIRIFATALYRGAGYGFTPDGDVFRLDPEPEHDFDGHPDGCSEHALEQRNHDWASEQTAIDALNGQ